LIECVIKTELAQTFKKLAAFELFTDEIDDNLFSRGFFRKKNVFS